MRSNESILAIICETFPVATLEGSFSHALWGLTYALLSESIVNVAHICIGLKSRAEGRLDLFLQNHVPVDACKPRVLNQFESVLCTTTQSLVRVGNEDFLRY